MSESFVGAKGLLIQMMVVLAELWVRNVMTESQRMGNGKRGFQTRSRGTGVCQISWSVRLFLVCSETCSCCQLEKRCHLLFYHILAFSTSTPQLPAELYGHVDSKGWCCYSTKYVAFLLLIFRSTPMDQRRTFAVSLFASKTCMVGFIYLTLCSLGES